MHVYNSHSVKKHYNYGTEGCNTLYEFEEKLFYFK